MTTFQKVMAWISVVVAIALLGLGVLSLFGIFTADVIRIAGSAAVLVLGAALMYWGVQTLRDVENPFDIEKWKEDVNALKLKAAEALKK